MASDQTTEPYPLYIRREADRPMKPWDGSRVPIMSDPFLAERFRSKPHMAFVRLQPCCVRGCSRRPIEAHHLTHIQAKARGLKAGDQLAVPLCRHHHGAGHRDGVHHRGDEERWWAAKLVDPVAVARRLWEIGPTKNGTERLDPPEDQ